MDKEYPVLSVADLQDINSYLLSKISSYNIVIAYLPIEKTGIVSATIIAKDILYSFKAIRFSLIVGIGSSIPYYSIADNDKADRGDSEDEDSKDNDSKDIRDIRLSDIIISLYSKSIEAIIQYKFGKSV